MVLASKMKHLLTLCLYAFSASACATDATDKLAINNESEHCIIEYENKAIPTRLSSPCQFVKNRNGGIRSHSYPTARLTIFIVMGKPSKSAPECSGQSQWFVIGDSGFVPDHVRDIEVCAQSGGDEIAYRDAFHYIPGGKKYLESMPKGEYD